MKGPPAAGAGEPHLEEADRAERAGELAAAAAALRAHLEHSPADRAVRLRFGRLLAAAGERAAARRALTPLEATGTDDQVAREATRKLADLDEAEGALAAAAGRWERVLADDIDDPEARARLARMRPEMTGRVLDQSQTLASPEGVETSRYRLLREIGRGATATVYLARDAALGLELALKVLHPQLAGATHSTARRRFFAEARVAAAIRHPAVVAIYDVDEAARALAMELVPGGTLRDRIHNHPAGLPPDEVLASARALLDVLAFVHARGVVHGDLKPSNLLLRSPGQVVLADFGTAQLATDGERSSAAAPAAAPGGTPLYLAPEQFRGVPASPATDLYAVGAILWEAATGHPLRTHAELLRGTRTDTAPPESLSALDPTLAALLTTLLDPVPSHRHG